MEKKVGKGKERKVKEKIRVELLFGLSNFNDGKKEKLFDKSCLIKECKEKEMIHNNIIFQYTLVIIINGGFVIN